MDTLAMPNAQRVQEIISVLSECLAELDQIDADVAAAHIDSALNALRSQFNLYANNSNTEYHQQDAS